MRLQSRGKAGIKQRFCLAVIAYAALPNAMADLGRVSWGALTPQNSSAGRTLYGGDGTFYGQQGNQNADGACSYGSGKSDLLDLPWTADVKTTIALNSNQFQQGLACGTCVMYRGTGGGLGTTPVPTDWQMAFVDNLCPECAFGSLDLNLDGNGRWNVEWFPVPCNVGNSSFVYANSANTTNPYWFQFSIGNTRVPVKKVEMLLGGKWGEMRRTFNNMYAANGGPFNSWPLPLRITSMLNDTVYDMLPSVAGGNGTAQFPDHGPAIYPSKGIIAETVDGLRQANIPAPPSPPSGLTPNPAPPPPNKKVPTLAPSPVLALTTPPESDGFPPALLSLTAYTVRDYGQCGGNGFYCSQLMPKQCKDSIWPQSSCSSGFSCQRSNESWWKCLPKDITNISSILKPSPPPTQVNTSQSAPSRPPVGSQELSSSNPAASPDDSSISGQLGGQGSFSVIAGGQCGGTTSYCASLAGSQCKDAIWDGAQCPRNYNCVRWNKGWWQCSRSGQLDPSSVSTLGRKFQ